MNLNQFKQEAVVGQLDLNSNITGVIACRFQYVGESSDVAVPGEGVILSDKGANDSKGPPIVDERAADANEIFGVKVWTPKENQSEAGSIIQVATSGDIIWMKASAAIARGADVALVLATPGSVVTASTETVLGKALDKASAADDLIRVKIA